MDSKRLRLSATLKRLPPEWPDDPLPAIRRCLQKRPKKLVVVDDDPTGSQTVKDVPVLTEWGVEALLTELRNDLPAFYILTNTRSMTLPQARAVNLEIGQNLREASRRAGREIAATSRGDSTLRGHFPNEAQSLADGLGEVFDAWLLAPALLSEGRFTLHDVQYVAEGDWLAPVGETAYARDATFGFHSSNLREWVEEKTGGRIPAGEVASIGLEESRREGPQYVQRRLLGLAKGSLCIVNAASQRDLEVFTLALLAAEEMGRRFLYCSGPSFVPARIGLAPYPALTSDQLPLGGSAGGLIVVGSYVPLTNRQMAALQARGLASDMEVSVERLLDHSQCEPEIQRVAGAANQELSQGRDVLVYTSRELVSGETSSQSLEIVRQVSAGLIAILREIAVRPRYILAKGGITSSDLATQGLGVRRAVVVGQLSEGVSVWELGPESRYEGMVYIVFPGNVGGPELLAEVVQKLKPGIG